MAEPGVEATEGIRNRIGVAFRACDPCFGCATHSMPGEVEMTTFDGTGLDLLSYLADSNALDRVVVFDSLDTCAREEGVVARVAPRPGARGEPLGRRVPAMVRGIHDNRAGASREAFP